MSAQLELFQLKVAARPVPVSDQLLGRVPEAVCRHSRYQPFDGALARAKIIELCSQSAGWVESRKISRACNMQPRDLACLERNMVLRGELEQTYLYYGSSDPREKNYRGFQHGYRIAQKVAA